MADSKPVTKTLYNVADGPRSIVSHDGSATVVPAGGSADVTVHPGELDSLHPELSTSQPKASADKASGSPATRANQTADAQAKAIEELATDLVKGHSPEELAAVAKAEGVTVAKDATVEQIGLAIAQKRLGENK